MLKIKKQHVDKDASNAEFRAIWLGDAYRAVALHGTARAMKIVTLAVEWWEECDEHEYAAK